jgi:hypothetical protein
MPDEQAGELTREQKIAALKAKADALKAQRTATQAPAGGGAVGAQPAAKAPAAPGALDVPVSSLNPGGRPGAPLKAPALTAYGTINNSVEIRGEVSEDDNLKKLLGGLGAYQNPVRSSAWQVDYRYYAEARRRLEAAGYKVSEKDYRDRPIKNWSPTSRGWTRVQP